MKAPVSVIILTLNEEVNIENCLRSVYGWSDDIHVVDSFSKDKTVELAMKYTDKIYRVKEDHWANLRNWALRNLPLKYDWVLFLDADERLTENLKKEIVDVLSTPQKVNGFYIKRRFIFMGKWLKHGDLYSKVLRLFKRQFVEYIPVGDVEYAKVKGDVGLLKYDMIHEDRKGISKWIEKHNRISDRAAEYYLNRKRRSLLASKEKDSEIEGGQRIWIREVIWERIPLILQPIAAFLYQYILKLGFLDGLEGFIYHFLQAFWYRILIYIKVKEKIAELENDF
jgi:glycosyltransferase involved in cell wall biosynthesis